MAPCVFPLAQPSSVGFKAMPNGLFTVIFKAILQVFYITIRTKNLLKYIDFLKRFSYLIHTQCSAFMYVYTPEEGTQSHYRWLWATLWMLGPQEELSVLLTSEPPFQPKHVDLKRTLVHLFICIWICACLHEFAHHMHKVPMWTWREHWISRQLWVVCLGW